MNLTHFYGLVSIVLKKLNGCQLVSQDIKRTCQENVGKIQEKDITTINKKLLSNFTLINMCQHPLLFQVWEKKNQGNMVVAKKEHDEKFFNGELLIMPMNEQPPF
jgi:hypothetical protein